MAAFFLKNAANGNGGSSPWQKTLKIVLVLVGFVLFFYLILRMGIGTIVGQLAHFGWWFLVICALGALWLFFQTLAWREMQRERFAGARRQVDRAPHDSVLRALRRADVAHHHLSGMYAYPHLDFGPTHFEVMFVYPAHCLLHLKGTADGALSRVRHHHGGTKKHEDGVPDDLINSAAGSVNKLDHGREVMVQQGNNLQWPQAAQPGR